MPGHNVYKNEVKTINWKNNMLHQRYLFILLFIFLNSCTSAVIGISATGSAFFSLFDIKISRYDHQTYINYINLKYKVVYLYSQFSKDIELDNDYIRDLNISINQAYAYENGKGEDNNLTTKQFALLRKTYHRHIKHRQKNGVWSKIISIKFTENIIKQFDIAIRTERSKNR